jgi:predicted membrane channel-forming protein YqfA (hemolysin III family)
MQPLFRRSAATRVAIFSSIAALSLTIVTHIVARSDWEYEQYRYRIDLGAIGWTLFFNCAGAVVYVKKVSWLLYWRFLVMMYTCCCFCPVCNPAFSWSFTIRLSFSSSFIFYVLVVLHGSYCYDISCCQLPILAVLYILVSNLLSSSFTLVIICQFFHILTVNQIPERFSSKFDVYGSSHQLFHIMVFIAAVVYLEGLLRIQAEAANIKNCG